MKDLENPYGPTASSDPNKDYKDEDADVTFAPLNHLKQPIKVPDQFLHVRWSHAIPELACNGCHRRDVMEDRFRYTCRTCGPNQYDLCKFCYSLFKQNRDKSSGEPIYSSTGHPIEHERSHELVEMDLQYPSFEDPVWHNGMGPAALQIMTQVARKNGSWDPVLGPKAGDNYTVHSLAKLKASFQLGFDVSELVTHVSFNGMNMSSAAVKTILTSSLHLEVIHFRSTPKFGGPELVQVFKDVLEENPLGLQQLHTIYATGCNFYDFRSNDPTKARDYAQELRNLVDKTRPSREVLMQQLEDPIKNGLLKKRNKWNPFGGAKQKRRIEELMEETEYICPPVTHIRVIMSMCDLKQGMSNPCGFPGLVPTVTYAEREPIHCYNQTRDILLELLTYLGTPGPSTTNKTVVSSSGATMTLPIPGDFSRGARLADLEQERARLIEFRKKRFLEHAGTFAGGNAGNGLLGYSRMPVEWRAEVEKVLAQKVATWSRV
ncbi:hypothetical protein BG004_000068 [Podila humilis]|nr:hypothetical protein BG004_000068 [Podila humilis]